MPLTTVENALRLQARELIALGKLPPVQPSSVWGGRGNGQPCSLCGFPVEGTAVEYELEFGGTQFRFHVVCHAAWQLEVARAVHLARIDPA
jgi:hypothetical protein